MKKIILLCLLLMFTSACGKKGNPEPNLVQENFTWVNVVAVPAGDCISVSGSVQGRADNLETIFLELQPVTPACENCPFTPDTIIEFPAYTILDKSSQVFNLTYCPVTEYSAYRWRLSGKNRIMGLPLTQSHMQIVELN